jgi:hypothetical protein
MMTLPERVSVVETKQKHMEDEMQELHSETKEGFARLEKQLGKMQGDVEIRKKSMRGVLLIFALLYVTLIGDHTSVKDYIKLLFQLYKVGG